MCQDCLDAVRAKAAHRAPPAISEPEDLDIGYAPAEELAAPTVPAADAPTCTACGVLMPPSAVLCTRCGHDTRTGAVVKIKAPGTGSAKRCVKCGYDLSGLKTPRCPECGTPFRFGRDRARERAEDARQTVRWAYYKPLITVAVGLAFLGILAAWRGGEAMLMGRMILYGAGFVIATVVYLICAVLWTGLDAPLHLVVLRMAGVCAVADAVAAAVEPFPMFIVKNVLILTVFVGMLYDSMDMELTDAAIVGLLTWGAKLLIIMFIVAYLILL